MNKLTGFMEPTFILENDVLTFNQIIGWKRVTKQEVRLMQYVLRKYIDPKATICSHCPAQIQFAHKRVSNWWNHIGIRLKVKNQVGQFVKKTKE